jgi:hypothetical protein
LLRRAALPFALLLLAACSSNALYWGSTPQYVRHHLDSADQLMERGEVAEARERYDAMAATGQPEALIRAGRAWMAEPGADRERASELFELAWSRKSKRRDNAGLWLARSIAEDDPEQAIELLEVVASRGERGASGQLAKLLIKHHPSDPRIERLLRRAGAEGDTTALLSLARRYEDREALRRAVVLLEEKSAAGDAAAANRLARVYAPRGPLPDDQLYIDWLKRAAERGDTNAMLNYGRVLIKGELVTRDPNRGIAWVRRAAMADDHWAQYELGKRLTRGDDVERDLRQGQMWLEKAAAQGNEKAERVLTEL